jgi:hypothetical protein
MLGVEVVRGTRVWGGYSPTPTFRLLLTGGRRAFIKGVTRATGDFPWAAIERERRIYRELSAVLGAWQPTYQGDFECDGWRVLLLEDLGPKSAPPWNTGLARRVMYSYSQFHRSTRGTTLPKWLPRPCALLGREGRSWRWADTDGVQRLAALAASRERDARLWLQQYAPMLRSLAASSTKPPRLGWSLLHGDTRSDNLRFIGDRLCLFDWPHASVGPIEADIAMFVQSIALESGIDPDLLVSWYEEGVEVDAGMLDAALAALVGFFANQAFQEEIPGLPRLRRFQRQQLHVTLSWLARRLGVDAPTWTAGL